MDLVKNMIELRYFVDLEKDERTFEVFRVKDLNKSEASNLIHFLEKVKLDILDREFELGEGGFEVVEDD